MKLTIGSRGSALARWQAEWVKAHLSAAGHNVQIAIIRTSGDRQTNAVLAQSGVKGLFIKEIEEALLAADVDLAVHSMKDLPTALAEGLALGAVPEREDPRDVLVTRDSRPLSALRRGGRIGTSSLRRESQLRALGSHLAIVIDRTDGTPRLAKLSLRDSLRAPHLPGLPPGPEIIHLRGNVDTRLAKLDQGLVDGLVLAAAGLKRLGLQERIAYYFREEEICPAVGQGALAIEIRNDDRQVMDAVCALDHAPTHLAVRAERAALAALGGGCDLPFAAHASAFGSGAGLRLRGFAAALDGSKVIRAERIGPASDPESLGARLALDLEKQGARALLASMAPARPD